MAPRTSAQPTLLRRPLLLVAVGAGLALTLILLLTEEREPWAPRSAAGESPGEQELQGLARAAPPNAAGSALEASDSRGADPLDRARGERAEIQTPLRSQAGAHRVLSVQLLQADGEPLSGSTIFADARRTSEHGAGHYRAQLTDDSGLAEFHDLSLGEWILSSPLGAERAVTIQDLALQQLTLSLPKGRRIRGIVSSGLPPMTSSFDLRQLNSIRNPLNAKTGIEGARIYARRSHYGRSAQIATSDAEGLFETPALPFRISLYASAEGYTTSHVISTQQGQDFMRFLLMRGGGTFHGQVLDSSGVPVPYAQVGLARYRSAEVPAEGRRHDHTRLTDAEGRFRFTGLWTGVAYLRLAAEGFATLVKPVTIYDVEQREELYRLEPEVRVEGHVSLHDGQPARSVLVYSRTESAYTKADGSFALGGLQPGKQLLSVDGRQHGSRSAELQLEPGELRTWNPRLPATNELRGLLLDEDGQPLAGWSVRSRYGNQREMQSISDQAGRFRLVFLEEGPAQLRIYGPDNEDYSMIEQELQLPHEGLFKLTLDETMRPTLQVTGSLLDHREQPQADAYVLLVRPEKPQAEVSSRVRANQSRFAVGPLLPGEHLVFLQTDSHTQYAGRVTLSPDSTDLGSLDLHGAGSVMIETRVQEDCELRINDPHGLYEHLADVHTGDGPLEIGDLGAGEYEIKLFKEERELTRQVFQVRPGLQSRVELSWP